MIYWQDGEPKMRDKRKYNQVVVDGLNPDQLDYIFIPGRPISLGTTVISSLARDVVEKNKLEKKSLRELLREYSRGGRTRIKEINVRGIRTVSNDFLESEDEFVLRALVRHKEGDFRGLWNYKFTFGCRKPGERIN